MDCGLTAAVGLDADPEQQQQVAMPKKKEPPLSAAEQRKRFEALAREVGAHQSTGTLKRVLGRVAPIRAKQSIKKK